VEQLGSGELIQRHDDQVTGFQQLKTVSSTYFQLDISTVVVVVCWSVLVTRCQ
jgi:hypothetical protein